MKKVLSLIMALAVMLSLVACGGNGTPETTTTPAEPDVPSTTEMPATTEAPQEEVFHIGDTVSTDLIEFTLTEGQLAIALSSVRDNTYCTPKEYNAEEDAKNPLVCAKGHTYATFTYTIKNLDRTTFNGKLPFISAEYKNTTSNKQVDGAEYLEATQEWITTGNNPTSPVYSWNFVLDVGTGKTFRSLIDIPVEAANLNDDFTLLVDLPNSDGSTSTFTYHITHAN